MVWVNLFFCRGHNNYATICRIVNFLELHVSWNCWPCTGTTLRFLLDHCIRLPLIILPAIDYSIDFLDIKFNYLLFGNFGYRNFRRISDRITRRIV